MSTTHSDQTPAAAPAEWRAAPPISTEPGAPDAGTGYPPAGAPAGPAAASRTKRGTVAAGVAALLIAVGGTAGYLVSHASAASTGTSATAQQGAPGGVGGAGTAGGAGGLGFQPADYHLDGTITAIGNGTVTITSSSGTPTTYAVTSSTHLMDNGATVPLSSFTVGESVRGSTTTQGGTTLNDMVGGAGTGARGGTPPQGTGSTGTTA